MYNRFSIFPLCLYKLKSMIYTIQLGGGGVSQINRDIPMGHSLHSLHKMSADLSHTLLRISADLSAGLATLYTRQRSSIYIYLPCPLNGLGENLELVTIGDLVLVFLN